MRPWSHCLFFSVSFLVLSTNELPFVARRVNIKYYCILCFVKCSKKIVSKSTVNHTLKSIVRVVSNSDNHCFMMASTLCYWNEHLFYQLLLFLSYLTKLTRWWRRWRCNWSWNENNQDDSSYVHDDDKKIHNRIMILLR